MPILSAMGEPRRLTIIFLILTAISISVYAGDNNDVYSPCQDTTVQRHDGFTFGIALASKNSFFLNNNASYTQLSPCDSRLSLSSSTSQVAVFRPKVDVISILTINSSSTPNSYGGFMVAFAGAKYAARSPPIFVADGKYIVTSFTLVLEFQQGQLVNLYWKRDDCASCKGNSPFVCLDNLDCAIKINDCKVNGGSEDCSLGIQVAFSGTDKHYSVLNSWYEVENLRQYSLYGLFSNLRDSLTSQYNKFF